MSPTGGTDAIIFDRDGTLVIATESGGVAEPAPSAAAAIALVRGEGARIGVVALEPDVAAGVRSRADVDAENERIDAQLGPFDTWAVCTHDPADGCACRSPKPGLIIEAIRKLGAEPARTVVIGDEGCDIAAARAAGARGILVPSSATAPDDIASAPETAESLVEAVELALGHASRRGLLHGLVL